MTKIKLPKEIFTVGHSNHPITKFIELLERHQIELVVDVRSIPYSRRQPQFNRETLVTSLSEAAVTYLFLGNQLGAKPDDPKLFRNERVQYELLAETKMFQEGIQRVADQSRRKKLVLMCAERDPLNCHRTILVSRILVNLGADIHHILYDGEIETHKVTMARLFKRFNLRVGGDLFRNQEQLEELAYLKQEKKITYPLKINPIKS